MPRLNLHHLAILLATGCVWVSDADHQARLQRLDADGDGYRASSAGGDDCDDTDPRVSPAGPERCATPYDDDCDGEINEEGADSPTWFMDDDDDGFGDPALSITACEAPDRHVDNGLDCDDSDPAVNPDAVQTCPGLGLADLDCDPTPRPCVGSVSQLSTLLERSGIGSFEATGGRLFGAVSGRIQVWEAADLELGVEPEDGTSLTLGGPAGRLPAIYGDWLARSVGDDVGVSWTHLGDGSQGVVISDDRKSEAFGALVTWSGPGELMVSDLLNGQKKKLAVFDVAEPSASLDRSDTPPNTSRLVAGGTFPEPRVVVAVQPDEGDGELTVLTDGYRIIGSPDNELGAHAVLVADVDGDSIPDIVASTVDTLHVWRGPLTKDLTETEAWWSLPIGAPVSTVVVADLGNDTARDLILLDTSGDNVVRVYTDTGRRPTEAWATLGPGTPSFGTSLGVLELTGGTVPVQALLIADPASKRILAMPWP